MKFIVSHKDKRTMARSGRLETPHGVIETPNFMPVGTQGSVKSLSPQDLREIGVQVVLGNTYHLYLRPGDKIVKQFGGLAKFMGWRGPASRLASTQACRQATASRGGPTFTDSGGFQVFSLGVSLEHGVGKLLKESDDTMPKPRLNKITEEGVTFQSHLDGSTHILTPEKSIAIQENLGADLIVAFDDLESPKYSHEETKKSLELTEKWLFRSKKAHKRKDQLLYGVTHGGQFEDLRVISAKFNDKHFDAIALGGAHRNKENMYDVVSWTTSHVSEEKPKHMFGIGEVDDIFEIVERGADTFDCVIPTRLGRMGHVFVYPSEGNLKNRFRIDVTRANFAKDHGPLSKDCACMVCQEFARGYINHLFRSRELLAYRLASYHNVYFLTDLMKQIREAIGNGQFEKLRGKWLG